MTDQSSFFPFSFGSQSEQERLRYAIQAAQMGTWHLDIGHQQVWWDRRCQELFGLTGKEVIAYTQLIELVHPGDRQRVDGALRAAFDPSSAGYYDVQFRTLGTSKETGRWLHCQGQAYVDVLGAAYRLSGVARDITAQVQMQRQLEASKARFRSLVLHSPTPTVLFVGRDMVIDTINRPMLQIWGKDESVTGLPLHRAVPELVSQPLLERLQRLYDTNNSYRNLDGGEGVVVDSQWQQAWFNFSYNPVYTPEGTIFGFINTATDVTKEVLALQNLQRSEVRFRALIEEAPVGTGLLVGNDLQIQVANEAMLAALGKDKEVLNKPLAEAIPELAGGPLLARLTTQLQTGAIHSAQGVRVDWWVRDSLKTYYVDWTAKPLLTEDGGVYAILVMATDVTRQVLAQQLIQSRQEQQTFLLQLTDQLRTLTNSVELYHEATYRLGDYFKAHQVGYAQDGGDGQTLVLLSGYNQDFDDWQEDYRYADFDPWLAEWTEGRTVVHADIAHDPALTQEQKAYYQAKERGALVYKPLAIQGEPLTFLFIYHREAHDWTEDELMLLEDVNTRLVIALQRAGAEAALRVSEQRYRLLSEALEERVTQRTGELVVANEDLKRSNDNLQQFAYIASHDLQEPLRKIQSFGDVLLQQSTLSLDEQSRFMLQRMVEAGRRMSILVSDLLAFSRLQTRPEAFEEVSLPAVIAGVLTTLELAIEQSGAQIQVQALPHLKGNPTQLGQLFQNLISNALKFIPKDRTPFIVIRAQEQRRSDIPLHLRPSNSVQRYSQIQVVDNGIGFDMKHLDRIFRVFQRLHGKGEYPGTGIGLAICQRVVDNHGGAITAESVQGQSATFTVWLPL